MLIAPDLERLARRPWPTASLASSGTLQFGPLMLRVGASGADKDRRKFGPRIGGAHIDNPHSRDARLWWLGTEQARGLLPTLHATPELALRGDNQMLVERIGMGGDFNPFAAAGDHGQNCGPRRHDPHVMLQLRHILFGCRLFGESPGQHELGLEHGASIFDSPIQRRTHPAQHRVTDTALDVGDHFAGLRLVPASIKVFCRGP